VLWTIATLLVRAGSSSGAYKFNLHMAIFCSESLKLVLSLVYYIFIQCVSMIFDSSLIYTENLFEVSLMRNNSWPSTAAFF